MPKQISDEEYAFLQNKRMTADFVESIYNDPQLNKEAKRLIKRKYPNLAIPDYDMEQKIDAKLGKVEEDKRKEQEAQRTKADMDAWNASRGKVKKEYGFTDEGLSDLERWMHEHAVADHEVAASYRASKNPQTSEPTYDSQFWRHEEEPNFKDIAKDPEAWGRKEILGAIHKDQERARTGR
jgi:ATP-dependent exoDNAse (exonuclease V) beta subunit